MRRKRIKRKKGAVMDYLEIAKRAKAEFRKDRGIKAESTPAATESGTDILIDNTVVAVLFDWPMAGPFWLALRDDFQSGDDMPVFFASELPHLRQMTPDELRRRYAEKQALGGGWIRDRIEH
jgi:hypothetical protein